MAIFLLPGTFSGVYSDPLVVLNRIFGATHTLEYPP